jgi:hypothetical protein
MYTIYVDGALLYAPNLADDGYAVMTPKIKMKLNTASSLECIIPPTNPTYDGISKLKSVIKVYDGNKRIFRGRVIDDEKDFYNRKSIMAQGELTYLNDSILRPYSYTGTVAGYFEMLVTQHNAQVGQEKQFRVGNVTATGASENIVRVNPDAVQTWAEMKDNLLGPLGGYIIPRCEVENGVEVEYLDYLSDSGGQNNQPIVFAENLLDLDQYIDASEVCTVLVPYGKADRDTGIRVGIESVNDGLDYIESATGIELFGRVVGTETWNDVTDPAALLSKAQTMLSMSILMSIQLDLKAVDLSRLGVDVNSIRIGEYNRVVSPPHGIDAWYQCSEVDLRLDRIDGSEFSFGATGTTLTQRQASNSNQLVQAAISAATAGVSANATANALNIALQEISQDYCTAAQYAALEARVAALEGN